MPFVLPPSRTAQGMVGVEREARMILTDDFLAWSSEFSVNADALETSRIERDLLPGAWHASEVETGDPWGRQRECPFPPRSVMSPAVTMATVSTGETESVGEWEAPRPGIPETMENARREQVSTIASVQPLEPYVFDRITEAPARGRHETILVAFAPPSPGMGAVSPGTERDREHPSSERPRRAAGRSGDAERPGGDDGGVPPRCGDAVPILSGPRVKTSLAVGKGKETLWARISSPASEPCLVNARIGPVADAVAIRFGPAAGEERLPVRRLPEGKKIPAGLLAVPVSPVQTDVTACPADIVLRPDMDAGTVRRGCDGPSICMSMAKTEGSEAWAGWFDALEGEGATLTVSGVLVPSCDAVWDARVEVAPARREEPAICARAAETGGSEASAGWSGALEEEWATLSISGVSVPLCDAVWDARVEVTHGHHGGSGEHIGESLAGPGSVLGVYAPDLPREGPSLTVSVPSDTGDSPREAEPEATRERPAAEGPAGPVLERRLVACPPPLPSVLEGAALIPPVEAASWKGPPEPITDTDLAAPFGEEPEMPPPRPGREPSVRDGEMAREGADDEEGPIRRTAAGVGAADSAAPPVRRRRSPPKDAGSREDASAPVEARAALAGRKAKIDAALPSSSAAAAGVGPGESGETQKDAAGAASPGVPAGASYEGQAQARVPHGYGTMLYPDGSKYNGEWTLGRRNGQGTLTGADGSRYVGEWSNDRRDGAGTLTYPDGRKYIGEWKNDRYDGSGLETFPDGRRYEGQFREGRYHGQGTLRMIDGKKYVGEFRDGLSNGKGILTFPTGRYEGEFKNNKYHGRGTLAMTDGRRYTGQLEEGLPHGRGVMILANGTRYAGRFRKGRFVKG